MNDLIAIVDHRVRSGDVPPHMLSAREALIEHLDQTPWQYVDSDSIFATMSAIEMEEVREHGRHIYRHGLLPPRAVVAMTSEIATDRQFVMIGKSISEIKYILLTALFEPSGEIIWGDGAFELPRGRFGWTTITEVDEDFKKQMIDAIHLAWMSLYCIPLNIGLFKSQQIDQKRDRLYV